VRERERERKRERAGNVECYSQSSFKCNKANIKTARSHKEKEYYGERSGWSSGKVAAFFTGSDSALKDFISFETTFVLRKQLFWVVARFKWVITPWLFEGLYRLYFQGYESVN
jgi:hypothetical protein